MEIDLDKSLQSLQLMKDPHFRTRPKGKAPSAIEANQYSRISIFPFKGSSIT
jgi:hypothetical protein